MPDFEVTVASRTVRKAEALINGHPRGVATALDVEDRSELERLVSQADLAVSMLPYVYHPTVAALCVKHGKHMVTTSYVKDEMRALDSSAREVGVILLNEIGVDPGIVVADVGHLQQEPVQSGVDERFLEESFVGAR